MEAEYEFIVAEMFVHSHNKIRRILKIKEQAESSYFNRSVKEAPSPLRRMATSLYGVQPNAPAEPSLRPIHEEEDEHICDEDSIVTDEGMTPSKRSVKPLSSSQIRHMLTSDEKRPGMKSYAAQSLEGGTNMIQGKQAQHYRNDKQIVERKQKKAHFNKQLEAAQAIYKGSAAAPKISIISAEQTEANPTHEVTFSEVPHGFTRRDSIEQRQGGYSEAITQMNSLMAKIGGEGLASEVKDQYKKNLELIQSLQSVKDNETTSVVVPFQPLQEPRQQEPAP